MVLYKNICVILLVFTIVTLCLAKPRWIWEVEENDENFGNAVRRGKNAEMNEEGSMKRTFARTDCEYAICPPTG